MAKLTTSANEKLLDFIHDFGLTSVLQSITEILDEQRDLFLKYKEKNAAEIYEKAARVVEDAAEKSEKFRV